jgi:hypothetical protein
MNGGGLAFSERKKEQNEQGNGGWFKWKLISRSTTALLIHAAWIKSEEKTNKIML